MRTIGLTGGIGSGKSTVAKILAQLGAEVIDADRVGHEVYRPGTPGWDQVTREFGKEILAPDGTIDRRKLGAIVFNDAAARQRLEAIVHPLIAADVAGRIAARRAAGSPRPVVVEAAVLIEANWASLVGEVWVVTAPPEQVVERVRAQRRLPPEQISARVAAQLSEEERRRHATVVISNSGTVEELHQRVLAAWNAGGKS